MKYELIDKAIEDYKGVFSTTYLGYTKNHFILKENDSNLIWSAAFFEDVCTSEEFNQRAKKLGWINGYKYGVEYPTNGKKPDLPDDVLIEWLDNYNAWNKTKYKGLLWSIKDGGYVDIQKFRIIDQRYKPVEQKGISMGNVTVGEIKATIGEAGAWYDYDKQQAIAFPPVNQYVEMRRQGEGWHDGQLLFAGEALLVVKHQEIELSLRHYHIEFRPLDWNRKAEEDKQRVVGAVLDSIKLGYNREILTNILEQVYDLGFLKLPEQK